MNRRQKWMKPVVDELEAWNARMVQSATPKGKFGEAIGYFRNQSVRLRQFLTHARLDLDNNIIERSIRPIAIGRKNWMFAGSEEGARRAALLMSLVGSCKLLGIDPAEYLGMCCCARKPASRQPKDAPT
ncbi:MAG: transposase [Fibrobacteres bacterium]|nr:transposase [Fibrobacterota bacterium]